MSNLLDHTPQLVNWDLHVDHRGVLQAIINVPHQSVNTFNREVLSELGEIIRYVRHDLTVHAVVFRSGKDSGFLAGADLHELQELRQSGQLDRALVAGQTLFQELATLRVPTVAVIQGPCLGGGLEFALACRYRVAVDDPRTRLGLPEVELGLLPAWGGTVRLPATIGLSQALPLLLAGKKLAASEALEVGLVDRLTTAEDAEYDVQRLLSAVLDGFPLKSRPRTWRAWLQDDTTAGQWLTLQGARKSIRRDAQHYPALSAILETVAAGLANPKAGQALERRHFVRLADTNTSRQLMQLFFRREQARVSATWIEQRNVKPARVVTVGVIGGGVMGAGIAQAAAVAGYSVILKEINDRVLAAGLARIHELFQQAVSKRVLTPSAAEAALDRVHGTTAWLDLAHCDLLIEAVTEQMEIKQQVVRELMRVLPEHAIVASNTSALSIDRLGVEAGVPGRVYGLHFFNPVHRMPLVEVVRPTHAADRTLATLIDFAKKLGKTPVVTADRPGFVVNRILFPYLDEAVRLAREGLDTLEIDRAITRFGMPMGPLELLDTVGLDVAAHVAESLAVASGHDSPTRETLAAMVAQGRLGKKLGGGFYDYEHGKPRGSLDLSELSLLAGDNPEPLTLGLSRRDVEHRVVLRLVNEAAHVLEEGIVDQPWKIDLAMVLGTGFAPFTGGPLSLAATWGYRGIVQELTQLSAMYGPRFTPSRWLVEQAAAEDAACVPILGDAHHVSSGPTS